MTSKSHNSLIQGAKLALPVSMSFFVFGITYGVAASEQGVKTIEAVLASLLVFSGSTQFVLLDMRQNAAGLLAIAVTVFLMNIRHSVMAATLLNTRRQPDRLLSVAGLVFLIDETWAIAMMPDCKGNRLHVLIGAGLVTLSGWALGTLVGTVLGTVISDPKTYGMDFIYFAVFLFIMSENFRGNDRMLPVFIAIMVAWLTKQAIEGAWYILVGGVAGALMANMPPLRVLKEGN